MKTSAETVNWDTFAAGDGRKVTMQQAEAEEQGVFGVPSFVIDGEIFRGREYLSMIEERLAG
jgi:2-hydroxychromene-2-carboxylate isomerase